jgi:glycerophosphoryl diester phosphodiesterase
LTDDWIISDFTFQELSTLKLRVKQHGKPNMQYPWFDNQYQIPSFQQFLSLIHHFSQELDKKIGIIPELKHSRYHNSLFEQDHVFENIFLEQLSDNGYDPLVKNSVEKGPLIIQAFEEASARYLRSQSNYYILQLVFSNLEFLTPKGLDRLMEYADAIGPSKHFYTLGVERVLSSGAIKQPELVYDPKRIASLGGFIGPAYLSREIKKRRLEQIVYTFYSSYQSLESFCIGTIQRDCLEDRRLELMMFFEWGVEGLFVENIPEAIRWREAFQEWSI